MLSLLGGVTGLNLAHYQIQPVQYCVLALPNCSSQGQEVLTLLQVFTKPKVPAILLQNELYNDRFSIQFHQLKHIRVFSLQPEEPHFPLNTLYLRSYSVQEGRMASYNTLPLVMAQRHSILKPLFHRQPHSSYLL
jgi:hypothetical protein